MATGLAIPVRAERGRAVLDDGARQMAKIVALAMSDGESSNPFNNDVGLATPVFGTNDRSTRALLGRDIRAHFARFQADDRARLVDLTLAGDAPGELHARVTYLDLETDEEQTVERRVVR